MSQCVTAVVGIRKIGSVESYRSGRSNRSELGVLRTPHGGRGRLEKLDSPGGSVGFPIDGKGLHVREERSESLEILLRPLLSLMCAGLGALDPPRKESARPVCGKIL